MYENIFSISSNQHEELERRTKYMKNLGWYEFTDEGDKIPAAIIVMDIEYGFSVFRKGVDIEHLHWDKYLDEAVEWAVDRARKEIADHEIRQQEREPKEIDNA